MMNYMRALMPGDKMVMSYHKSQKPSWQGAAASNPLGRMAGNMGMGQPGMGMEQPPQPPVAPPPGMGMNPSMGPSMPRVMPGPAPAMMPGGDPGAYASPGSAPSGPDPRERMMLMQAMRRRFGGM